MNWAIIVGHSKTDPGACNKNGLTEYQYNIRVSQCLSRYNVFLKDENNYPTPLNGFDSSIELHCNAFDCKSYGCGALYLLGDEESKEVAEKFVRNFSEIFKRRMRGVTGLKLGDRGHKNLMQSPCKIKILVEPFFIDNIMDLVDPISYAEFLRKFLDGKI